MAGCRSDMYREPEQANHGGDMDDSDADAEDRRNETDKETDQNPQRLVVNNIFWLHVRIGTKGVLSQIFSI